MNWIASENYLVMFLELNDEDLEFVKNNKNFFADEKFIDRVYNEEGKNAVVYGLVIKNGAEPIAMLIDKVLLSHNSVSWWDREHGKFFTRMK